MFPLNNSKQLNKASRQSILCNITYYTKI